MSFMSKTNFTKVEEALVRGLDKQTVEQLLAQTGHEGAAKVVAPELRLLFRHLQQDLKWLLKQDRDVANRIQTDKPTILRLVAAEPETLNPEDWKLVHDLQTACTAVKADVERALGVNTNDALIRKERRKHINKRFNVSDKWLPLQ